MMRLNQRWADSPYGRDEEGAAGSRGREAQTNLAVAKRSRGAKTVSLFFLLVLNAQFFIFKGLGG